MAEGCWQCKGRGYYYSEVCVTKDCDHVIRDLVVSRDKNGKPIEHAQRMICPKRPCSCRAGVPFHAAIKAKVARQEARFAMQEQWR